MSDPLVRNIKLTIGGPEETPGTAESRTAVIPAAGLPTIDTEAEKVEDPCITGNNMTLGEITVAQNVSGDIPLAPRCCPGFGKLINSALGQEDSPTQIAACIAVRYTGTEASCKLGADTSADELTSDVGDFGDESGDTDFGTAGVIDLTAGATDTVAELVAAINAYDHYDSVKVFGDDDVDAADIVDITSAQGASRWVYVFFSGAATGYYLHKWSPVLTNTLRPVYSYQGDGLGDDYLYDGLQVISMNLSAAIKGMLKGSVTCRGFEETTDGITASAVELEDVDPLIFSQGSFSVGETEFTYVRSIDLTMANEMSAEGYGMGSLFRQYHKPPAFSCTGKMSVRWDATLQAMRSNVFDDSVVGISFRFKANSDFATDIPQLLLVDIPYAQLKRMPREENEGSIDIGLEIIATNPSGAYSQPLTVYLITDDAAAY